MSQIGLVEIFNIGEETALIVILFVILYFSVIWVLRKRLSTNLYLLFQKN